MGVQIYLLDSRAVTLNVGGHLHAIGAVRRSWKITELNGEKARELAAEKERVMALPSPTAVLVADVAEMPLSSGPGEIAKAHLVLGWDSGRLELTDLDWDYLPVLGYAVRNPDGHEYVLHEAVGGKLSPLNAQRAVEFGVLDESFSLIRRGQPHIIECRSVRPFIQAYVQAECTLNDGRIAELLTKVEAGRLPEPQWFLGKRPADIAVYEKMS